MDHRVMTAGIVMTLAQLTYFIEIAKTKNFTEAASNLYISQSNISYAIHALEDELDALLFVRRPNKRIELTMYGETLYPHIAEGIRLIEEGKNRVSSMKSPLHGSVRLAFFHSIVFSAVPALMSYFREDNPGNEIEFQTMVFHNWTDFRQLLLDGKCDLVLSAGNLGNGCESVKVAEHHIFLIVPADHPYAERDSVSLRELRDVRLIQIDANSNMDMRIKEMAKEEGVSLDIKYEMDWTAQQLAVMSGRGLALSCDVTLDGRFLRKVQVDHPLAVMPLYLSWASKWKMSGAALYVRDYYLQLAQRKGGELVF